MSGRSYPCAAFMVDKLSMKMPWQRTRILSMVLLALVCVIVALHMAKDVVEATLHQACPISDPLMDPKHEVFRGHDFLWQIPPRPKAVLILAHGAHGNPFSFFDHGPGCELCYGLPDFRNAAIDALKQGYAVLAPASIDWIWVVWPLHTDDLNSVTELIGSWTREHSLEHLPHVGWGFSSGGWFLSSLSFRLPLQALVFMGTEGDLRSLQLASPGQFPPAFFVHMLYDDDGDTNTTTLTKLHLAITTLLERGIPVKLRQVLPKPLSPTYFSDAIDCMREYTSSKIYGAFKRREPD